MIRIIRHGSTGRYRVTAKQAECAKCGAVFTYEQTDVQQVIHHISIGLYDRPVLYYRVFCPDCRHEIAVKDWSAPVYHDSKRYGYVYKEDP